MADDFAEQEARELQAALALSLQEYNASGSPSQPQRPQQQRAPLKNTEAGPSQVKIPAAASGGRGRRRKLQRYAPTDDEIDASFRELVSGSSSKERARINDIVETGKKLGLDIDPNKAVAMLEYLGEQGVTQGVGGGGITLQDFQAIAHHFRTE